MAGQRNATIYWRQELEEAHVFSVMFWLLLRLVLRSDPFFFFSGKNPGTVASECRTEKTCYLEFESNTCPRQS